MQKGFCSKFCPLACSAAVGFFIALFLTAFLKFRPEMYSLRSSSRLTSTIAAKIKADEFWLHGNKRHMYAIEPELVSESWKQPNPKALRYVVDRFIEMFEDDDTKKFINNSIDQV
jgi:hypothetical protein